MEDNLTKVVVCQEKQNQPINQDTFFIGALCVDTNFQWVILDAFWSNIGCLSHYEKGPVDILSITMSSLQT